VNRTVRLLTAGGLVLLGVLATPIPAQAAPLSIEAPAAVAPGAQFEVTGSKEPGSTVTVDLPGCTVPVDAGEEWSCTGVAVAGENVVTASDGVDTQSVTVVGLAAPTRTGPALTNGRLVGGGYPGAAVDLDAGSWSMSCPVDGSGVWSCDIPSSSSGDYTVAATQRIGSALGAPTSFPVTLDRDPPLQPGFAAPSAGQQLAPGAITVRGTGEPGARLDLRLNGAVACTVPVAGSGWSCTLELAAGAYELSAIQSDPAGNQSASIVTAFTVATPASAAPAPPAPGRPTAPRPQQPETPEAPQAPAETGDPAANPETAATPPTVAGGIPFFAPPVGGESGLPPLETWDTPTHYGAAIPAVADVTWWLALLVGAGFLLLVAVPALLLAAIARPRADEREPDPARPPLAGPWATGAIALAGAILLAALAGGIQAEVRYLRLVIAIGLALLLLNGVGVALATRLAGRVTGTATGLRLAPLFLAIGAVVAIASRVGGVQPPLVIGVVVAATTLVAGRPRGMVSVVELAAVTVLGLAGWVGHSILGPVEGFWPSLLSETLAALTVAAFGSALALLLPVGRMPGRAVWEWSPVAWIAVAIPAAVLGGAVFSGGTAFPMAFVAVAALGFATVAIAAFVWVRFVRPQVVAARS
jgi:hypothetical protein